MATGTRASVGENKQPSSLPCAHCRKTISGPESPKFLNDVLCIRRAKSENTEFSVLDALAQVFGVRLTVDSAVTCDQLCICGSCLGLLQRLFLAHLQFSKKNSSIIRELGVNCNEQSARAPSHSDNSTQTDSLDTNTNGHMAGAGSQEIRPEVDLVKHRHVLQSGIRTRRSLRVRLPHGRIEIESARILADMKTANTASVRGEKDDLDIKKRQSARYVEEDHDYIPFDEDNDRDSNSSADEERIRSYLGTVQRLLLMICSIRVLS